MCMVAGSPSRGSSPRGRGTREWPSPCRPSRSVHPRAGGEHPSVVNVIQVAVGSSPRGRGTLNNGPILPLRGRFIPARAGNTSRDPTTVIAPPVHPRAGGEHYPSNFYKRLSTGSSPRGRGTLAFQPERGLNPRFIPARAGNTPMYLVTYQTLAVHPRAGGEHHALRIRRDRAVGSSPRGRGTHDDDAHDDEAERFIPARAGNTLQHPAEVRPLHGSSPRGRGSSPRGRGTQPLVRQRLQLLRFIPARAGNTKMNASLVVSIAVHPRAGGEHPSPICGTAVMTGSSPRGRGTPASRPGCRRRRRFIPARAGNTYRCDLQAAKSTVHPRAGGEHTRK